MTKTLKILLIVFVVLSFISGGVIFWLTKNNSLKKQPQSTEYNLDTKELNTLSIVSDEKLLEGDYLINTNVWSPDSDKFFLTREVGITDIGLPEYLTYDIFDLQSKKLGETNIQDYIAPQHPYWQGNNTLVTEKKRADISDIGNISLKDNVVTIPEGYELLEQVTYTNPYSQETKKSVKDLSFSPDKKFAAFISNYGSANAQDYGYRLFIMPQGAQSLDEMKNFGKVAMGVEVSMPTIEWSKDGKYLLVQNSDLFDVEHQKAILPQNKEAFRWVVLSRDEKQALVITLTSNNMEIRKIEISVKSLATQNEVGILSLRDTESRLFDVAGDFSPDGKYVVYSYKKQLWVASTITGNKKQLTPDEKEYVTPRWSNDGNKIIYKLLNPDVKMGPEIRMITLNIT